MNVTTTESYTGLSLLDLLKQIYFETGQMTGTDINAVSNKFPRWWVAKKLNDRQNTFVKESECLRRVAIIILKAGYRTFKLPENCMDGGILSFPKFYSDTTTYQNLEIKDIQWLDNHYEGWLAEPSSDVPLYAYMGNSYGNIQMLGLYPSPSADGGSYLISPDVGVTVGSALPGTSSNIVGQATGGSTTELDDSSVDFTTMGLVAGIAVLNVTHSSQAVIVSVAAHAITLSTLSGGTAFNAGDSYNILAGEYGVVTSWSDPEAVLFGSEVGEISNITVPKGNVRVEYIPYPLEFPETGNDGQYPEIPRLYHMSLAMGVVADILGTFQETTKEFQRAMFYEKKFQLAVAKAKSGKSRPFHDKPVSIRPVPKRSYQRGA